MTFMKRASVTLLICTLAGVATVIALARPATETTTAAAADSSESAEAADESTSAYGSGDQQAEEPAAEAAADPGQAAAITIEGFAFGGTTVVSPGQSVTVENLDSAPHTVTAVDGSFDTGTIDGGGSTTLTLPTEPGTYEFFCAIHPSMVATVTVQA